MKKIISILKWYPRGVFVSVLYILSMYLLDYIKHGFIKYAEWNDFVFWSFVGGIPFGIFAYSLSKVFGK
jgi:hypothetical protein